MRRSRRDARQALAGQRKALEAGWRGDHYALDFADDGREVDLRNAMTTGWAAYSGACDDERALAAVEGGLKGIERANRVLLLETPFYEHSQPYPGRIADYPPGVRENGGQYSHGATWIVDGFMRLAASARAKGDVKLAARLGARAFEIYEKISPLKKTDPENLATYGLIPIQQPADIYDGWGHGGRGGWSWYTGSAARMLSAAYALLGVEQRDGQVVLRDDLFEPKGELKVQSLRIGETSWTPEGKRGASQSGGSSRGEPRRGPPRARFVLKPAGNCHAVAAKRSFWQEAPTNEPRESARGLATGLSRMLLGLIIVCGLLSIVYGVYTINSLMAADAGTARMQEISGAVAEGAQAYLQAPVHDHRRRRRRGVHRSRASAFLDGGDRLPDRRDPVRRRRLHRHERFGARQRPHRAGGDEIARRRPRHRLQGGRGDRPARRRPRAARRRRLFRDSDRPSRLRARRTARRSTRWSRSASAPR